MASGRHRIIVGKITVGNVKGKKLGDELFRELNQNEKGSTYQNDDMAKHDNK